MILPDPIAALRDALAKTSGESSDFDLNKDVVLPAGRKLRPAGVLVPVITKADALHVILTKRSSALKHHPGQIAFPGGKVDEGDANTQAAALREAHEEIGLAPDNVEVLGDLPCHETVTGFTVTPVLGRVRADFDPTPEPGEVAEVFEVIVHVLTRVYVEPSSFLVLDIKQILSSMLRVLFEVCAEKRPVCARVVEVECLAHCEPAAKAGEHA